MVKTNLTLNNMQVNRLIEALGQLFAVPDGLEAALRRRGTYRLVRCKKGRAIPQLRTAQYSGCFVRKGQLKAGIRHADGREEIFLIWEEGQFADLDIDFFNTVSGEWEIAATRSTELICIGTAQQQRIYGQVAGSRDYQQHIRDAQHKMRDTMLYILHSPKADRWAIFQERFPCLWPRISNTTACGLLDISATTLARSKARR